MHGGRLVARTLGRLGVTHVFGLCGDHINAIFDGCADEGVRIVDMRDERSAGHAAEGWSLATGDPGVAVVTGGPGLTNVITPLANAFHAGTSMVVLTSGLRRAELGRGFPQDVDQRAACEPFTVWFDTVEEAERIPGGIAEAFAQARARRGPAVVEVSLDAQLASCEDQAPPLSARSLHPSPSVASLDAAARPIGEATAPVLIAGEGCFWSDPTGEALRTLAESAGVPVFTVRAARGLIPDAHERALGQPNFLRPWVQDVLGRTDVLVVAGCELDIVLAFGGLAPQAQLVRIEADAARAVRNRAPAVAVVGDEAAAMRALTERLGARSAKWALEARELRPPDVVFEDSTPVHPGRLVGDIARAVAGGTATVDAGHLALWALDGLPATGPGRLVSSFTTPMATIGPGLPYAIAAKLARPDEPAIALLGDGAFGFAGMEIDTAARHGIGVVAVVGNDASWGIVRRQMEAGFKRAVAADLAPRRYDLVAAQLGAHAEHVDGSVALEDALARALASNGPAVVDVALDSAPEHEAMAFVARMFAPEG